MSLENPEMSSRLFYKINLFGNYKDNLKILKKFNIIKISTNYYIKS